MTVSEDAEMEEDIENDNSSELEEVVVETPQEQQVVMNFNILSFRPRSRHDSAL